MMSTITELKVQAEQKLSEYHAIVHQIEELRAKRKQVEKKYEEYYEAGRSTMPTASGGMGASY